MKKFRWLSLFFSGISCFLLYSSCNIDKMCSAPVLDSIFIFRLYDQYGNNQIAAWGARYNSDSTFVTKENGEISNQFQNSGGGDISFFIPESYTEALDSEMTRTFLLYLPDHQGHPKADIDTITFKYRFKLIEEVICYDYQQIIYNDSLYHSGKYQSLITFTK